MCSAVEGPTEHKDGYHYTFKVKLEKKKFRSEASAAKCLEHARRFIVRAAEARHWKVIGEVNEVEERKEILENRPPFKVGELNKQVMQEYFDGIYERDAHL